MKKQNSLKISAYDLGQVAKHLKIHRGPQYSREFIGESGKTSAYDLSKIRIKKNW